MKKTFTQSITAYRCRICKKRHIDNLLLKETDDKDRVDLENLLYEFFNYIKKCRIDEYTHRAIVLSTKTEKNTVGDSITRLYIQPKAGRSFENFDVVDHETNGISSFKGENNSAVYNHNVLIYLGEETNTFIFHRYGQSGCKTVFSNIFNEFLATKGLVAHFDILLSDEMFASMDKYMPEKISLITTYTDEYSDKSDNTKDGARKKIEQETIISLNAPRAKGVKDWFVNLVKKEPSIDELKEILIKDDFPTDFEDAKLTVKFGKVRRRISLSEFSGLIAEYDITDKLVINADGTVSKSSICKLSDDYALSFMKQEDE